MAQTESTRCECQEVGELAPGAEGQYDAVTERPFVDHEPGKCRCTNDIKLYVRHGKRVHLCSCCWMSWDHEVTAESAES